MNTWFSLDLGDGVAAYAPTRQIQDSFMSMFMTAGGPVAMALFSRYDLNRNVVTVYFSPVASQVATLFAAKPCEKPHREDLGLLAGDQRCWNLFYPTSQE